jgi:hypothetical protein
LPHWHQSCDNDRNDPLHPLLFPGSHSVIRQL